MAKQNKDNKKPPVQPKRGVSSSSVFKTVIQRTNSRTKRDIKDWRLATMQAESKDQPRRLLLYNIYDDVVLDNHLSALMQVRAKRLMSQPFRVVDTKTRQEDKEKTAFLKKKWFYKFMELFIEARSYGHSLIEISSFDKLGNADCQLVPRRHVYPEYQVYVTDQWNDHHAGIDYTPLLNQYLIEVGGKNDLGLLLKATPMVLWKKNAIVAWSEYAELFGMPTRVGKTNSRNTADVDRMEDALINAAKAQYVILQAGEELTFESNQQPDAFNVYNQLIERVNSELSKLYFGNTMTTDNGSSRSQAEVHERVSDFVAEADTRDYNQTVNSDLFQLFANQGINWTGFEFEFDNYKITKEESDRDIKFAEMFEIEPEYFKEKYKMPITGFKSSPGTDSKNTKQQKESLSITKLHAALHELYKNK
jgi:hypothetical protein